MLIGSEIRIGDIVTITTGFNLTRNRISVGWVVAYDTSFMLNIRGWTMDHILVEEMHLRAMTIKLC